MDQRWFPHPEGYLPLETVRVAVGAVLRPRRGGSPWVLIGRRRRSVHLGALWELPGGKIRPRETGAECVRREVSEEMGIEVTVLRRAEVREHRYTDRTVCLEFWLCRYAGGEPGPVGCSAVRWVSLSNLDVYPFPEATWPFLEWLRSDGARERVTGVDLELPGRQPWPEPRSRPRGTRGGPGSRETSPG